ncbi:MAG: hypothetical protein AMJ94_15340 [Deltaproteobacteria bacterium SM23_61]|nr:MAG: hypothetical protein AMJ94_15340 [Deltaproteobacteria bacterium SM23_61]
MSFAWVLGFFLVIFLFSGCSGSGPSNLGGEDNRLAPCPSSPNCVTSQSDDERHRIDPIRFSSSPAEAMDRLKKVVRRMERTTVVSEISNYLHVEFRTFLGFVDDAEFYLDESQKVIHLRSASRVGYWDLGVNRRRMESIRRAFGEK